MRSVFPTDYGIKKSAGRLHYIYLIYLFILFNEFIEQSTYVLYQVQR
jgi:hypothetical protein